MPDAQALEWIDATHHVRWTMPASASKAGINDATTDGDERRDAAMKQAEHESRPIITHAIPLASGAPGYTIYVPITANGNPDGFLAAVFKADTSLKRYLPPAVADGEALTVSEGGQLLYGRDAGQPASRKDWVVQENVHLRGTTWQLRMWPAPELAARLDSMLPVTSLCAGVLSALLLAAVTYYAQRSSRQANEAARANAALRTVLDQVKTLEGLLPICCGCKRVRDDGGYWSQVDTYLRKHTKAALSHSYCPECAAKFYEECGFPVPENVKAELAAGNFE